MKRLPGTSACSFTVYWSLSVVKVPVEWILVDINAEWMQLFTNSNWPDDEQVANSTRSFLEAEFIRALGQFSVDKSMAKLRITISKCLKYC